MASAKGHRLSLEDLVSAGRRRTRQGWVLPPQSGLATRGRESPMMRERLQRVTSRQFSLFCLDGSFGADSGHLLDRISALRFERPLSPTADVRSG